jgi:hypothetical protein
MSDSYKPLLKAVIAKLKTDNVVAGDRVYTDIPQNETFPYVHVAVSAIPYATKDTSGMEHTVQVQAFDRTADPESVADIRSAVFNSLDRNESGLTLDTGTLSVLEYNGTSDIFKEGDGVTWQGLIQFKAIIF